MYAAIAKEEPFSVHCQVDHNEYGVISSDALEIYKFSKCLYSHAVDSA